MTLLADAFLISHSLNALIALWLVIVTLRLYNYSKIWLVLLISTLMASWTITNFLLIFPLLFDSTSENTIEAIASWNIIGSALVPGIFIIFIDSFEGKIDPKKVGVATATIGAGISISLAGLLGTIDISSTIIIVTDLTTMRWSPLSSLAIFPTVLLCGYWTQTELKKSQEFAYDPKQLTQIKYMRLGGFLMFIVGPIFGILGVVYVDGLNEDVIGTWLSEIIGYTIVSIGIIMLTVAYTRSNAIAFLQPQRINSLLVISENGVPIHQYQFNPRLKMQTEIPLISGAISAITAIMGEAFNVSSNVRNIQFQDKEILLEFHELDHENENLAFILITESNSKFLKDALYNFSTQFMKDFGPQIHVGTNLSNTVLNSIDKLIRVKFGYEAL
ncbi:MAG: hypothetical protein HeimC2_19720 [Candidatus Heimdallarchaeota archaeon LC_2]|nr:MAG: hypothetical protein HeimC2_19720 [Candidatus Heimdallarchaeota archaeon LC_2]